MKDSSGKKSVMREVLEDLLDLALVLIVTFLIINYVGQRTQVNGGSMEPTLQNGDNLITDKISYRFREPERFDIIVFPVDDGSGKSVYYIKRIIGLPGETIRIEPDGSILVNGEKLNEGYGKEIIRADNRGRAEQDVLLSEDEYFVMGDNRNNSSDSRFETVGNVKREEILGRAWMRFWPFSKFGRLKHQ